MELHKCKSMINTNIAPKIITSFHCSSLHFIAVHYTSL